jgi:D-beta-D-heptose 7-phosphate kinase/D-beta-D-heptose 1-phosphate adenosyltransferase
MSKDNFKLISEKIIDISKIEEFIFEIRNQNKKIVFSNGCFDIIHRGHVEYLAKASNFGDILIIGLNSDNSVRKLKGENRPVQDQNTRALILSAFSFIDFVIIFDQETPYELIKLIKPDFLVKGADYKPEEIVGYDILQNYGGQVKTIELVKGHSTTNIIGKFLK